MESFKVSHDSLFKNTLRILHEGIRHDLSIQTQDEILTCNRAFLELYPSLKEKIDDSSQMLQLQDYKGEVIRAFLEFVYTGKVTIVKKSILEEFQNCAKSLDIPFTIEISKGEIPTSSSEKSSESENLGLSSMANGNFLCLQCNKIYTTKGSAVRHYKMLHKHKTTQKNVKCRLCEQKFSHESYMKDHLRRKHKLSTKMLRTAFVPEDKAI